MEDGFRYEIRWLRAKITFLTSFFLKKIQKQITPAKSAVEMNLGDAVLIVIPTRTSYI